MSAGPLIFHKRRLWHPFDLTASRVVSWWDADALPVGSVASWPDMVNGLNPVQATGASKPSKGTGFPGSYGAVQFDGVDDNLRVASLGALPIGTNDLEMWTLFSPTGTLAANATVFSYGKNTANQGVRQLLGTGASAKSQHGNLGGAANDTNTILAAGSVYAGRGKFFNAGASISSFLNDDAGGTNNAVATNILNTVPVTSIASGIGTPGAFYVGYLRHILITKGVLSSLEAQKMFAWLLWDVSQQTLLPSTNPFKLIRP